VTVRQFIGAVVRTVNCCSCHRDGTVSYYDAPSRSWVERAPIIPAEALALLPSDEADRVRRHLWRHGVAA
jgi:hypothetical protein